MPADIAHVILEIIPDPPPIVKVAFHAYRILTRSTSHTIVCLSNWLQARFNAQELGAYLGGTIQTRCETHMQDPLPGSFQVHFASAAFQYTFLGHYIFGTSKSLALPLVSIYTGSFELARPPPSVLRPTLACLRGGVGDADSGADNEQDGATADRPPLFVHTLHTHRIRVYNEPGMCPYSHKMTKKETAQDGKARIAKGARGIFEVEHHFQEYIPLYHSWYF